MRIERLEIEGWMPFASQQVLELPAGPIAVVGTHDGDSRRSNRAGKTSLLEAITWALYGAHRKRLDDAVIHRAALAARVQLELTGMSIVRRRARGKSTTLQVQHGGQTLTGEAAQQRIVQLTGLALDDYLATSCFRQGDVESIVARTAGERLTLVSEWLQLSRWAVAKKRQLSKLSEANAALGSKRAALDALSQTVLSADDKRALEEDVRTLRGRADELREQLALLQERVRVAESARSALALHAELKQLRERASELRKALVGRAELEDSLKQEESAYDAVFYREREAARQLESMDRITATGFDGVCPVMCAACPEPKAVENVVRLKTEARRVRQAEHSQLAASVRDARAAVQIARGRCAAFEQQTIRYSEVVARGKRLSESLREDEASAQQKIASAERCEREFVEASSMLEDAARLLGEKQRTLDASASAAARCDAMKREVGELEQRVAVCALAARALASIPSEIAKHELLTLERQANLLLHTSGVSLRFSWSRELSEKAPSCDHCGHVYGTQRGDACPRCSATRGKKLASELEILADDGSGSEEDVRFNSGGTRAIVGASLRLAASSMLRRLRGAPAAWALVDEPFAALDSENRESLARAFAGMLGSVGLQQALVVSHDPVLLSALPHRIVIDKSSGASCVRMEG